MSEGGIGIDLETSNSLSHSWLRLCALPTPKDRDSEGPELGYASRPARTGSVHAYKLHTRTYTRVRLEAFNACIILLSLNILSSSCICGSIYTF